jgi:zinc transporter ZupT
MAAYRPLACIIHEYPEKFSKALPVSSSSDLSKKQSVFWDVLTIRVLVIGE